MSQDKVLFIFAAADQARREGRLADALIYMGMCRRMRLTPGLFRRLPG